MRIVSILLLTFIGLFLLNIVLSFSVPAYHDALRSWKVAFMVNVPNEAPTTKPELEAGQRIATSLDKINENLSMILEKERLRKIMTESLSGETLSGATDTLRVVFASGVVRTPIVIAPLPLSGVLLAKIMPTYNPKLVTLSGAVFGLPLDLTFGITQYQDTRHDTLIYVFERDYPEVFAYFKSTPSQYTLNENTSFFKKTLFLNLIKPDDRVRFIFSVEGKAIAINISKKYYPILKKLLTKIK